MQLEQEISRRAYDGAYLFWQRRLVGVDKGRVLRDLAYARSARAYWYERAWKPYERWVAVGVFPSFREACTALQEAERSERAPAFAGQLVDGVDTCEATEDFQA